MFVLIFNRRHINCFHGKGKKSREMEVSLEWNDICFKMCIKIGEFVLEQLNGKTYTNAAIH